MIINENLKIVIATPHMRYDNLEQTLRDDLGFEVLRVREREGLEVSALLRFSPRYIFFPHWSWVIPPEIFENFECVIFHMTDLPFGRGGSPLQNLIVRGISETKLTALRCVAALDAGPIYIKRPLSLLGTAEEILSRASNLITEMIGCIALEQPKPIEQMGEVTTFSRRSPADGNLASLVGLREVYDYIRMLDADGYPPAFIETNYFRFEFSDASINADDIVAQVKVTRRFS
jgi:methionyl-tRNA formyltransferase